MDALGGGRDLYEQDVTLADGSTQKVLAPQLYARVQEGDLAPSGALLAGNVVRKNGPNSIAAAR